MKLIERLNENGRATLEDVRELKNSAFKVAFNRCGVNKILQNGELEKLYKKHFENKHIESILVEYKDGLINSIQVFTDIIG